jgi:hypothetical protein
LGSAGPPFGSLPTSGPGGSLTGAVIAGEAVAVEDIAVEDIPVLGAAMGSSGMVMLLPLLWIYRLKSF